MKKIIYYMIAALIFVILASLFSGYIDATLIPQTQLKCYATNTSGIFTCYPY